MAEKIGKVTPGSFQVLLREKVNAETSVQRRRRPFLTLWPNGQFSLSYKYRTEDAPVDEDDEWHFLRGIGYQRSQAERPAILVSPKESSQVENRGEGRKSAKYGLRGITRFGAKMVRSAAHLTQRRYGRFGTCFMTLTVPALSRGERKVVAERWGEIMRQVVQRLSRLLAKAGQPKLVVSVTELQSARLKKYGQAYLHAHLIFPSRKKDDSGWAVDVVAFRAWYKDLLERIVGRTLDYTPRVETKTLRKSAEGYIGKYMTKGTEAMEAIVEELGEDAVPGQQWNMSKDMRDLVKSTVVNGFEWGEVMQAHIDMVVDGRVAPGCYMRRVEIDIGGRVITPAWVGNVPESLRESLWLPAIDRNGIISINRNFEIKYKGD